MKYLLLLLLTLSPVLGFCDIAVGVATVDITPAVGTPSAGYADRKGAGMEGVHDPLLATCLFIDTGTNKLAFCSVDNLGLPYAIYKEIQHQVTHATPELRDCQLYIGSSHTHSGGGAFLDIPVVGQMIAGIYKPEIAKGYVDAITNAVIQASKNKEPALIGLGYGKAEGLSQYRSTWPETTELVDQIALFKVTKPDGTPLALLCNYALHPTTLDGKNRLFSADFVGPFREKIASQLGKDVACLYFNGAQAEITPQPAYLPCHAKGFILGYGHAEIVGKSLADQVKAIWDKTVSSNSLEVACSKKNYSFTPKTTPVGLTLPLERYDTELNFIKLNKTHLFITIPGELSCLYDRYLQEHITQYGLEKISILGLTNDAHGYILTQEAWNHKTSESALSFGGADYGDQVLGYILSQLQ